MLGLVDMPVLVSWGLKRAPAHDAWYQDFCTKPQRALKFPAMKFWAAWPFSTGTEDLQVSERRRLVLILKPFVQNC